MKKTACSPNSSLIAFVVLVFVLSLPMWLLGASTQVQLLPGLPISALAVFVPVTAAAIMRFREEGFSGVQALLKRAFDFDRIVRKMWYFLAIILNPAIALIAFVVMYLFSIDLPDLHIPGIDALLLIFPSLIAAFGEELGWSGYALELIKDRWNAFMAAVFLGFLGAMWHYILFLQAGRDSTWIVWQSLVILASRVVVVWLYYGSGRSVFITAIFHAMLNLSWQLFPNNGSHYDPRVTALIMVFFALIVTLKWRPQMLVRHYAT
jgi:membrane protease YdiL (CAAX protease family)